MSNKQSVVALARVLLVRTADTRAQRHRFALDLARLLDDLDLAVLCLQLLLHFVLGEPLELLGRHLGLLLVLFLLLAALGLDTGGVLDWALSNCLCILLVKQ